jgi:glycosyltransferase involved in cell wall biosynthesis
VITVVLNGEASLSRLFDSVAHQDYLNLQYIVVDGGSADGTLDVIAAHRSSINVVIRGPDSGIAEAMNKGLAEAKGDFVLFLHADDRFVDSHALSRVMPYLQDTNRIWACEVLFGEGGTQRRLRPRPFNFWARLRNPLPHQGVLFPRRLFDQLGVFDTRWRISMDYELWLLAMSALIPLVRVPEVISVMGDTGVSSRRDWTGLRARLNEERSMQRRYAPNRQWRLVYAFFWPAYLAYRRFRCWLGEGS